MRKVLKPLHPLKGEDIYTIILSRPYEYRCKANKRLRNQCSQSWQSLNKVWFYYNANIVCIDHIYLCTSKLKEVKHCFELHFDFRSKANKRLYNQCSQPVACIMMIRFHPIANIVCVNYTYFCTSKPERANINI